jgi:hypothetical protein
MVHPLIEACAALPPEDEETMLASMEQDKLKKFAQLKDAIAISDRSMIVFLLRYLSQRLIPLPPALVGALSDYLNPDIPKRLARKPKRLTFTELFATDYCLRLYEDQELARYEMHRNEPAFKLIRDETEHVDHLKRWFKLIQNETDHDGQFKPTWKHPDLERNRSKIKWPPKSDIQEFVAQKFDIKKSTLQRWITDFNKKYPPMP